MLSKNQPNKSTGITPLFKELSISKQSKVSKNTLPDNKNDSVLKTPVIKSKSKKRPAPKFSKNLNDLFEKIAEEDNTNKPSVKKVRFNI